MRFRRPASSSGRSSASPIGRPDIAEDPRFNHPKKRIKNVAALTELLSEVFRARSSSEWGAHLFAERIPAAPVNGVAEAVAQPLALLRNMVEELEHPRGAGVAQISRQSVQIRIQQAALLSPARGAETRAMLERVCGYDAAAIDRLIARNVVYQGEKNDTTK